LYPCLHVDCSKLRHNASVLSQQLHSRGLELIAVTKGIAGAPQAARAFLDGGAAALADSRLENVQRLRRSGFQGKIWLLRPPTLGQAGACVDMADVTLASEWQTLQALSRAAVQKGIRHRVYLMVELGDLREGVMPAELPLLYCKARGLPSLEVAGIGTNLACLGGIYPTREVMGGLQALAKSLDPAGRLAISAGNSSALHMMKQGSWSGAFTASMSNLRIGESLLLGWDIFDQTPLPGLEGDACVLDAEILELKNKPSLPWGQKSRTAFGAAVHFPDRGIRRRALLALGKQDIGAGGIVPMEQGIEVLASSSDHVVLDVEERSDLCVGSVLRFSLDYASLLALAASAYVKKHFANGRTV